MPPNRPYFNSSGEQIRQAFEDNQDNLATLKLILAELELRSTPRMKALRTKVEERCCGLIETDTMIRSTIIKRRGVQ